MYCSQSAEMVQKVEANVASPIKLWKEENDPDFLLAAEKQSSNPR